ncbi:MAG: T9SS type A sorting domain-containing protein [Flavobacteriales bacterium]|nr:T9SS type A sorting domain-containing protein [Flavobacteriales bacterium]MCX7649583.1 T9SS type A sorting domain-containing protein [Flavobacteriales bacterium]MDW8431280.1 T9SS type A sorting domain-containing protein [Flavobacteriales bacterium]
MKKLYSIFIFSLSGLAIYAQPATLKLVNYAGQDVSNGTVTRFIFPSELHHYTDLKVVNTGNDAEVMVKRENVTMPAGYVNYFCWGTNCYPPSTDVSTTPEFIPGGQQNFSFIGYIQPDTTGGNWSITYTFFEPGNASNKVSVTLNGYTYMASLQELPSLSARVYPNPARERFFLDVGVAAENFRLSLTDLTGRVILSQRVSGNQASVDVRALRKGLYLYHVDVPGYRRLSGKVWIE